MMPRRIRILLIDDDPEDAELVQDLLEDIDLWEADPTWVDSYEEGLQALAGDDADVCLLDYRLGARTGLDFLAEEVTRASRVPVIFLTGEGTSAIDRKAWEAGAADYLAKADLTAEHLERAIRYASERRRRRRAEARLDALVGTGRELISVLSADGTRLYVSPSLEHVLGWSPEEKVGTSAITDVHPDDRDKAEEALGRLLENPDKPVHLQHRIRHRDGSWRMLDTVAEAHLDDPDIRGVVVSSWDVTERVEQEERIRFQADLLDAVGQAVIATDLDGTIIYWNQAAEEIYGWRAEEALGEDVVDVTPSDSTREEARQIFQAMTRGEPWTGEFLVRRKDGTSFPALVTNSPILDNDGELIGIVGASSDISELKEAQAALQERVKELRTLYQASQALHRHELSLEERLRAVVEAIPPGFLHPEVTEARLTVDATMVQTEGFREAPWKLSADIDPDHGARGRLEVVLTEERPEQDEGPFLAEEVDLLETLARTVAEALERGRVTRQLAQTIESLEEAVFVIDTGGEGRGIASANRAAQRMFGYSEEELVGGTTERIHVDAEHFRRFAEEGHPELEETGTYRAAYPLKRKDGTVFEAEQTVTLLAPGQGLAGGAVSVIRDVSEARRAERELRESEERFRQIAERVEDVFWISNADGSHTKYVSPAYRKVWGRDPEDLYQRPRAWAETLHPEDRERVLAAVQQLAEGGYEEEYRIIRPDGEVRWIHDRAFPVRDEEGEVTKIIGVAEDITSRKQAEERFAVLSQEITDLIFVIDVEGTVLFSSPSVKEILGYSREEFEGMDAFEILLEEDYPLIQAQLEAVLAEPGATARAEYRARKRDGEVRTLEAVGRNLIDHPAVGGILVTSRDVTHRMRMEERLRQSQRIESIGRLAGGIAHDFNNLLTVIRSQTDLLLLDLEPSNEVAQELEVIQSAADRATKLTSQLLAFSREQVLRPRVVNLTEVVRGMGHLIDRIIGESITVTYEMEKYIPAVELDPAQIEQVLLNMAVNARDAMPQGGVLTLATYGEEVDAAEAALHPGLTPGRYTVIRVSDTGVGMDEETRSRIFEPFYSTKPTGEGTGLGLAMAYGVVKQSGGTIYVETEPGRGASFHLRFPAVDAQPETPRPQADQRLQRGKSSGTILVIEDDSAVRRAARKILERAGFTVEEAETAEAGLKLVEERSFNAVLTDLVLPGLGGRDVLERIRGMEGAPPVIVMSGYAADSPGHPGSLDADVPFVQKPFSPDGLVRVIREAMAGR